MTDKSAFASVYASTSLNISGGNNRVIVRFNNDGTMWVNPDLAPDAAAKAFLNALRPQLLALYRDRHRKSQP
jgi:hypothetical protein